MLREDFIIALVDPRNHEIFYVDSTKSPENRMLQFRAQNPPIVPEPVLSRVKKILKEGYELEYVTLEKRTRNPLAQYEWRDFLAEQGVELLNEVGTTEENVLRILRDEPLLNLSEIAEIVGMSKARVSQVLNFHQNFAEQRLRARTAYVQAVAERFAKASPLPTR